MSLAISRFRLSVDDYHKMVAVGIIDASDRVELLRGEIIAMSPIGSYHAYVVNTLGSSLANLLGPAAPLSFQGPLALSDQSEPIPDLMWLAGHPTDYLDRIPTAQDVRLLIEVADTTLEKDREMKLPLYAEAGIPEVWLFDLQANRLRRYTHPRPDGSYRYAEHLRPEDEVTLPGTELRLALQPFFRKQPPQ